MAVTTRPPHIVALPHPGFLVLRIFQILIAVAVLALCACETYWFSTFAGIVPDGFALTLFTCCVTFIVVAYFLISSQCAPAAYNFWAVMSLEIFALIFWLCSFALLAEYVAVYATIYVDSSYSYSSSDDCYGYSYCYRKRDLGVVRSLVRRDTATDNPVFAILATAMVLAILEFILFIVSLSLFSVRMHAHRKAGMPNRANAAQPAPAYNAGSAPEKVEAQPQQGYHQPSQQPHNQTQQPYHQAQQMP